MRIWDLPCSVLCRQHLLGEHRELHATWNIITQSKKGYANHPEVKRWENHLLALWWRHEEQKREMLARGYNHASDIEKPESLLWESMPVKLHTIEEQREILRNKGCDCII